MKTTIDLPEEILHRAKIFAVRRKTTLKELMVRSLTREMDAADALEDDTGAFVAAFSRGENTEHPVGKVPRHEIYDRPILHRL